MAVFTMVLWALSLILLRTESCESKKTGFTESRNGQKVQYCLELKHVMSDLDTFKAQVADLVQTYGKMQGHCTMVANIPSKYVEGKPRSCADTSDNGVTTIYPDGATPLTVSCDQDTDGGGWTVFQRRQDGSVDFYRNWTQYQQGFGDPSGEFWLGLDALHMLTSNQAVDLRVDLMKADGTKAYATYSNFRITDSSHSYRFFFDSFTGGNAEDSLSDHLGYRFSTWDRDNDVDRGHCAVTHHGAWWYYDCYDSNLNAAYDNIKWWDFSGRSNSPLTFTEMKLRPAPECPLS